MYHSARMRVCKRVNDIVKNAHDFPHRERPFLKRVPKRFALDVGHRIVEQLSVFTRREQRHDVRVLKLRRDLDLAPESLAIYARGKLRRQYLYHDLAAEGLVGRDENAAHARAGELALYVVRG